MATHSSILAWRIPWTEKPDGLQSIVSQRDRHDRSNLACTCILHRLNFESENVSNYPQITQLLVELGVNTKGVSAKLHKETYTLWHSDGLTSIPTLPDLIQSLGDILQRQSFMGFFFFLFLEIKNF